MDLWDNCVKYVYGSSGSGVLSHRKQLLTSSTEMTVFTLSLESWKNSQSTK